MSKRSHSYGHLMAGIVVLLLFCVVSPSPIPRALAFGSAAGKAKTVGPSTALQDRAAASLERLIEKPISADDQSWLRGRWSQGGATRPEAYTRWLESIALAEHLTKGGIDPLAVAWMRHRVIDELYCRSLQTSDPDTHRSRSIVATPDLVLAQESLTGAVVTRFDLAALARSNVRVAQWVGVPADAASVQAQLLDVLPDGLKSMHPQV